MDQIEQREWLRREISKWESEGIIDDRQAEAILSRYDNDYGQSAETLAEAEAERREIEPEISAEESIQADKTTQAKISDEGNYQRISRYDLSDILPEDRGARLIFVITLLGSVLLGVGALLFVASNWNAIPQYIRFLLLYTFTIGTYLLGWRLRFQTKSYPQAGHALLFLACIFVGATIFLTAQIFNVNADVHWLILFWLIAISPMGYGFYSRPILGLFTFDFVLWIFVYLMTGWHLEAFMLYLVMGICFYGIGALHTGSERYSQFRIIYQAVGIFLILASSQYFSIITPRGFEITGMDWPFNVFFFILALAALGTLLMSIIKRERFGISWQEISVLFLAFLGWAAALFMNLLSESLTADTTGIPMHNPQPASPLFYLFNLICVLLALGTIMIGERKEEDIFLGLGSLFIGLEIIHLLIKGEFLIGLMMGIAIFCLSLSFIAMERRSRFQDKYEIAGLFIILAAYLYFSYETAYISEISGEGVPFKLILLLAPIVASISGLIGISRYGRLRALRDHLSILLIALLGWIGIGLLALFWNKPYDLEIKPDIAALSLIFFSLTLFALSLKVILIGDKSSKVSFVNLGALFFAILLVHLFIREAFTLYLLIGIILYGLVLFYTRSDGRYQFQAGYQIVGIFLILGYYTYLMLKGINELDILHAIWPFKIAFFLIPFVPSIMIVRSFRRGNFRKVKDELSPLLLALMGWAVIGLLSAFRDYPALTEIKPDLDTLLFVFFSLLAFLIATATTLIGDRRSDYRMIGLGALFIGLETVIFLFEEKLMFYLPMGAMLYALGLYCSAFGKRSRSRIAYQNGGLFLMFAYYLYLSLQKDYYFEIFEADWPFKIAFLLVPFASAIVAIGISQIEKFKILKTEIHLFALALTGWIVIGYASLFWIEPTETAAGLDANTNAILFAIFNLTLFALSLAVIVIGYCRCKESFMALGLLFIAAEVLNVSGGEFIFVLLLMGTALYALGLTFIRSKNLFRYQDNFQIIGLFLILVVHFYLGLKRTYYFEIFEADWPIKGIFFLVPLVAVTAIAGASRKLTLGKEKYDLIVLVLAFLGWIAIGAIAFFWRDLAITASGRAELISEVNIVLFIFFNLLVLSLCVSSIAIGYFSLRVLFVNMGILFIVIDVLHIYFTTVYAYLPRSIALIVGGLILIAGGWRLEKVRRSLIKEMDLVTTKEDNFSSIDESEPAEANDER